MAPPRAVPQFVVAEPRAALAVRLSPAASASSENDSSDEEETTDDEEESSPASVPQEAAALLPEAYVDLIINAVREASEKKIESLLNVCK